PEAEPAFAGALGERADAAVVAVSAAVEDHVLGASLLAALGDQLTGALGLLHAGQVLELLSGPADGGARRCRPPSRARDVGGAGATGTWSGGSCALADLPGDVLVGVANALALV